MLIEFLLFTCLVNVSLVNSLASSLLSVDTLDFLFHATEECFQRICTSFINNRTCNVFWTWNSTRIVSTIIPHWSLREREKCSNKPLVTAIGCNWLCVRLVNRIFCVRVPLARRSWAVIVRSKSAQMSRVSSKLKSLQLERRPPRILSPMRNRSRRKKILSNRSVAVVIQREEF